MPARRRNPIGKGNMAAALAAAKERRELLQMQHRRRVRKTRCKDYSQRVREWHRRNDRRTGRG